MSLEFKQHTVLKVTKIIFKKNSFFVDKLIENGAIIIGKTNTAELWVGGHTINRLFGPTSNVYDLSKSSGGSSGGASSAVAAQLIPLCWWYRSNGFM